MRTIMLAALLLLAALPAFTDEGVYMPWDEFKALYRQVLVEELTSKEATPAVPPMVYSLDQADYTLTIAQDGTVRGDATFAGTVLSGAPELVPLLGPEAVLTDSGANGDKVVFGAQGRIGVLPETETAAFDAQLTFLLKPKEEGGVQLLMLTVPNAVRNVLSIAKPDDVQILDAPGLLGVDGRYHFAPSGSVTLRYTDRDSEPLQTIVEIDALSRLRFRDSRVFIGTHFVPLRPLPATLIITAPDNARLDGSSVKTEKIDGSRNQYQLITSTSPDEGFSVNFTLDLPSSGDVTEISLPTISANSQSLNHFVVDEPDDGKVTITGEHLGAAVPVASLAEPLRQHATGTASVMTVPSGENISVAIERFRAVDAPPTILDAQYLYTSFDENGTMLSVLILDAPPELGQRLHLKAVPDSELWSLTVNGEKRSLYAGSADTWVVPLAGTETSHVELAVLRKGPQLGLQGQVDITVPGSGLPSKTLGIGLALPPRVEILSIEGPVKPAQADAFQPPAEFLGKPYFFSQSFYQGEGMTLSLTYKEPVKTNQ